MFNPEPHGVTRRLGIRADINIMRPGAGGWFDPDQRGVLLVARSATFRTGLNFAIEIRLELSFGRAITLMR